MVSFSLWEKAGMRVDTYIQRGNLSPRAPRKRFLAALEMRGGA